MRVFHQNFFIGKENSGDYLGCPAMISAPFFGAHRYQVAFGNISQGALPGSTVSPVIPDQQIGRLFHVRSGVNIFPVVDPLDDRFPVLRILDRHKLVGNLFYQPVPLRPRRYNPLSLAPPLVDIECVEAQGVSPGPRPINITGEKRTCCLAVIKHQVSIALQPGIQVKIIIKRRETVVGHYDQGGVVLQALEDLTHGLIHSLVYLFHDITQFRPGYRIIGRMMLISQMPEDVGSQVGAGVIKEEEAFFELAEKIVEEPVSLIQDHLGLDIVFFGGEGVVSKSLGVFRHPLGIEITGVISYLPGKSFRPVDGENRVFRVDIERRDIELKVRMDFFGKEAADTGHSGDERQRLEREDNPVTPLPLVKNDLLVGEVDSDHGVFRIDPGGEGDLHDGGFFEE